MNLIGSLFQASAQPDVPMHVGEVMALWTYMVAVKEARALCLLMSNHTSDTDLRQTMQHFMKQIEEPQAQELMQFMRKEGIQLPEATADKPDSNEKDVPPGAKYTDDEIANILVAKLEALIGIACQGMMQALRDDVAGMLWRFQQELWAEGVSLKKMMQKRGWLKIPPYYYRSTNT